MRDKILYYATIILSVFGLVMIYSSSYVWASYKFNNAFKYVINQGIFLILGIILMTIREFISFKSLNLCKPL